MAIDLSTLLHVNLRCVNFHLRRATRSIGKIYDRELKQVGLRDTYFTVLVTIGLHTAPLTIDELAVEMAAEASLLKRTVDRMSDKGWLQWDVGGNRLKLTDAGKELLEEALPIWRELQGRLQRLLGAVEMNSLLSIADRLVQFVKDQDDV